MIMINSFKLLLTALLALVLCSAAAHAEHLTVFDGSQVSVYVPLPTAEYDESGTRGQVIYPAEALAPMMGKPINGITLYINDEGCKMNGGALRVSMGEVADTTVFTSTTYFTGLTQVALVEMTAGLVELDIDFDTPYTYNGGNLVIDFYVQVAGEAGAYNFTYFYGLYQTGHTALTGSEYREFLPKTTFDYGETLPYSAKVSPRFVAFDEIRVGERETASVYLRNNGLNAFEPAVSVEAPFSASIPAGLVLQPGMSQEVVVTFEPTASGAYAHTLYIDCGEAGVLEVPVSGTALENGLELTVCEGEATNQYVPFNGIYADDVNTYGQMIYPAEKLVDMKDGKIVAMSFYTKSAINLKNVAVELSMLNTDQDGFEQAVPVTGLTAVATTDVVKGETVITFELDSPFEYTGGNLAIEARIANAGWTATTIFLGDATDNYASLSCYKSWSGDKKDRYQFLPMATFVYQKDTEPAGMRGDVDGDDEVGIADVTALIDILVSGADAPAAADCDLDDEVGIADVTALIDYLLSGNW